MALLNIIAFVIFGSAHAAESDLKLKYFVNNAYTSVQTQKVGTFRVNDVCSKNPKCKALTVGRGKPVQIQKTKAAFVGNSGANYCWDVGAKNRILKDEKNNQYDYCVFEDGSMIDAWDLFSAHYPAPTVK